jgi:hypothetical protein
MHPSVEKKIAQNQRRSLTRWLCVESKRYFFETAVVVPVPLSLICCGPVGSGSPMLRVAVMVPVACGLKVIENVQVVFAGTLGWQVLV